MSYGLDKFSTRVKLLAGAVALVLAGSAQAVTLVGGGATLPSVGYVGANAATTTNLQFMGNGTGPTNIDATSLFGVYNSTYSNSVSYCLTGSGAGKNILGLATGNDPKINCTSAKLGFGGTTAGRSDLTQASFAAADSPLATTDVDTYHTGHGSTSAWPTQFPAVAGAVGIAFNVKDAAGNQIPSANFTTVQLCKIFSHTVTTWNDPALAGVFPAGHTAPSTAISVEYRSDGSGTSFSFSNFLSNNCGGAGLAHVFETNQTFGSTAGGMAGLAAPGSVMSMFFPPLPSPGTPLPNNWFGNSGNTGVAMAISTTGDSIGYVETANALKLHLSSVVLATVNNVDPVTGFGNPITVPGSAIVYNQAISASNNSNGTAALTTIPSAPATSCIALVAPANYAIVGSKGGLLPTGSYPIVAISYILGNAQSNPVGDLLATQNLVNAPYNSTIQGMVTTIGPGTGLAFLGLGSGAFSKTAPGACLH